MELKEMVAEMAIKYCKGYPGIATRDSWEQLYAMKAELEGTRLANDDLHRLISMLAEELGWTSEQVVEYWELRK